MATDLYSGKFDLMGTMNQLAPLLMAYMMMKQMGGDKGADMAGARAQGMGSMMPDRGLDQAQPMIPDRGSMTMGPGMPNFGGGPVPGQPLPPMGPPMGGQPQQSAAPQMPNRPMPLMGGGQPSPPLLPVGQGVPGAQTGQGPDMQAIMQLVSMIAMLAQGVDMPMYSDPASYYGGKRQETSQNLMNMLNIMYRIKQMKGQKERWEQRQELDERRVSAYETDVATRAEKPPSITQWQWRAGIARSKVQSGEWTKKEGDRYQLSSEMPEKPEVYPAGLVKQVRKWNNNMSESAWNDLNNEQKEKAVSDWRIKRRQKPDKPTAYDKKLKAAEDAYEAESISKETLDNIRLGLTIPTEKAVTPTTKLIKRVQISKDIEELFAKLTADPSEPFENIELIQEYTDKLNIHLDMPSQYTEILRYMEYDLATPKDIAYFEKANTTREYLEKYPEIYEVADILPKELPKLDRTAVRTFLKSRKKKKWYQKF